MADPWFVANYGDRIEKVNDYEYAFRLTASQWDDINVNWTYHQEGSPFYGMKVRDIGFWNLIKDQAGQEGYAFIADTEGYYSNTMNWNAAVAVSYMIGSDGEGTYRTMTSGYDQIAYSLAKDFTDSQGAQLWTGNRLETFTKATDSPRRYRLTFYNTEEQAYWTVDADSIILAMPKRSLELLDRNSYFFQSDAAPMLNQNIDTVFSIPSFKLLMGFTYPWWKEDHGIEEGKASTDLPMSQCYYFGTDPSNNHSLLLASYNDLSTVPYWNALIQYEGEQESAGAASPDRTGASSYSAAAEKDRGLLVKEPHTLPGEKAPKHVVDEARSQLSEVHGNHVPEPYTARIKDWSRAPYGGGYHNWRTGVAMEAVMPFMRHPLPHEAIHIVGDAYSGKQGWIEGAFCETEKMLQESYHLQWPTWLSTSYYLGF